MNSNLYLKNKIRELELELNLEKSRLSFELNLNLIEFFELSMNSLKTAKLELEVGKLKMKARPWASKFSVNSN